MYYNSRTSLIEKEKKIKELTTQLQNATSTTPINKGKGLDEVEKIQKNCYIKETTKKALWFTDSYNADVASVQLKTRKTGQKVSLNYNTLATFRSIITPLSPNEDSFDPSKYKTSINKVLYLTITAYLISFIMS